MRYPLYYRVYKRRPVGFRFSLLGLGVRGMPAFEKVIELLEVIVLAQDLLHDVDPEQAPFSKPFRRGSRDPRTRNGQNPPTLNAQPTNLQQLLNPQHTNPKTLNHPNRALNPPHPS